MALSLRRPCADGLARSIVARRGGERAAATPAWRAEAERSTGPSRLSAAARVDRLPPEEERRINWRRASARTGLCLVLVTLAALVLSEALPERVGSGLRELSAALRMIVVSDFSRLPSKNGEAIDGPGGAL